MDGVERDLPTWIYRLPGCALPEFLQCGGTNVGEVVRTRGSDDLVPDHGLVLGHVPLGNGRRGRRPLGCYVDEDLLRVPGEEGREVGL